jgi:transcriptional regulator with PAS, ATPase and Fis domain
MDEIGDLSFSLQSKLLRFLEERRIEKIGSMETKRIDVRIIAATNRDLAAMVDQGAFRQDLYYRLNVIPLYLPPLRDRKEDIPALTEFLMNEYSRQSGMEPKKLSPDVMQIFKNYNWPGNIRELRNVVEYINAMVRDETVKTKDIPPYIFKNFTARKTARKPKEKRKLKKISSGDLLAIKDVLQKYGRSTAGKKMAAGELGISLTTLYRRINRYNL